MDKRNFRMKKQILVSMVTLTLVTGFLTASEATTCTSKEVIELIGAANTLNDSIDFSNALLENSKDMLSLSESLLAAGSMANTEYIEAMLQLSKDIGEMADRIGEMADRILVMADKIGDMSDRIVETQKIESQNVKLTQANLLQAEKNLNAALDAK